MTKITFPIINLTLNINKIAFTIFEIEIYWYAIIIVSSIIIALLLCKKQDGKYNIKYKDILDLSIILLPISFISARIYYCIFNLNNYKNLHQILSIKAGGLAIYGGIIGGVITAYIFCKKRNIKILDLLDYIAPYLSLAQAIGRWGNFVNVEAYGTRTNLPWKMGIYNMNEIIYVHPTFLYESICTLLIFIILLKKSKKRKYSGEITYYYILMYSFVRAIIENLRIDSLMFYNLKISQILSIILFVIFCIIISKKQIKLKNIKK